MCGECPARPGHAPPGQRKTPPQRQGERPLPVTAPIALPAPAHIIRRLRLFSRKKAAAPPAAGELSVSASRRASPGKRDHAVRAQESESSAAPAARRLTPHPRPVPCARSTPPPSPRSAWRALSHLRTLSLPREPRRMGAPESLSPGLTPAHLRPSLPARKKEHPGRPRESGRRKRRLSFEERGTPGSQNPAAPAAGLRRHAGFPHMP